LLCLTAASCVAGDLISSWKLVDDELSFKGKVVTSPYEHHWTNSSILRRLVAQRDTNALLELAGQPGPSVGAFSSYFALRNVDRDAALDVGIKIVLSTSFTNLLVSAVLDRLINDLSNPGFKNALTRAFRVGPIDPFNAGTLIRVLPDKLLLDWFEDPNRPASFPTCEALVVDRLYSTMRKRNESPTMKMKSVLQSFVELPGVPRLVFVTRIEESHPAFKESIRLCLEDESLPYHEISGLLYDRARFVEKHFDLTTLNISQKRRSRMTNDLAQALRSNAVQK